MVTAERISFSFLHTHPHSLSLSLSLLTGDVVDLPVAVMLASAAAAPSAAPSSATVLPCHPQQAAGHLQLGGLGEVRQDAPRRAGQASLQSGCLGLRSLGVGEGGKRGVEWGRSGGEERGKKQRMGGPI